MNTRQRRAWTAAFVIWLCVVWGHSLMQGDASSAESSAFVDLVRPLFELFGLHDETLMSFIVRKTAHFTEYAILMFITHGMVRAWFGKTRAALVAALAVWILAPCIDETIQLFIPGRAGAFRDSLIDMSGGATGWCIASLVSMRRRKRA